MPKKLTLEQFIEYDGKQHFERVNFAGKLSEEQLVNNLIKVKHNDKIKNEYCIQNNIKLLRIKYTECDQIEEILKRELNI